MKKIYLSLFLSILFTPAFSQQKAEFGFVLKAGNFTSPFKHQEESTFSTFDGRQNISMSSNQQQAGNIFSFGVRESVRLGGYVRLSGELLYRLAAVSSSTSYSGKLVGATSLDYIHINRQWATENSIAIPIKLHFSFKENGRTTLSLGAGISRVVNSEIGASDEAQNFNNPLFDFAYEYPRLKLGMQDFAPEMTLSAGLYHRINNSTSMGLEFTYERRRMEPRYFSPEPLYLIDCLCYGFVYRGTPSLRNFSVALNHTLSMP